jgi:hypothetical protein
MLGFGGLEFLFVSIICKLRYPANRDAIPSMMPPNQVATDPIQTAANRQIKITTQSHHAETATGFASRVGQFRLRHGLFCTSHAAYTITIAVMMSRAEIGISRIQRRITIILPTILAITLFQVVG